MSPLEGRNSFEWYSLGCQGIGDVNTTQERNEKIDYAIANKSWLIEMWHDVTDEDNGHYQWISTEDADAHLFYIAYQRDNGNNLWVDAILENDQILIKATYDNQVLDESIFNFPLTIMVQLPKENDMYLKDYFNDDILCKKHVDDSDNWYLLVNCVSNQGITTINMNK